MASRRFKHDFGLPLYLADNLAIAFSAIDTDGSGSLSASEIGLMVEALLPQLNQESRTQITDAIMSGADVDGNGEVDYAEFMSFVERRNAELEKTVGAIRHVAKTLCGPLAFTVGESSYSSRDGQHPSDPNLSYLIMSRLTPQCLSSMFYCFAGSHAPSLTPKPVTSTEARHVVTEVFPDLPELCILDAIHAVMDIAAAHPMDVSQLKNALAAPFEHLRFQSKRLAPLAKRASIAELKRDNSSLIIANPLNHLTEQQVSLLTTHIDRQEAKNLSHGVFRNVAEVSYALRRCFSESVDDELIEDVTNVLFGCFPNGGNCGVGELMRALMALNIPRDAQSDSGTSQVLDVALLTGDNNKGSVGNTAALKRYSLRCVSAGSRQLIIETLGVEETDLLRDTFIRLDTDGDGLVSLHDCTSVSEDVMEDKFFTFQPYLMAIFNIADKDRDGALSLEEFLMSFIEGPGVVPQEVVAACVVSIRLRLTDDEMLLVEHAFVAMDEDQDNNLSFKELFEAIRTALQPQFPQISDRQYQDVADVIFSKADRNLDGKLNLSEFTRSLQEEQGVIPIQIIEHFGKLRWDRPSQAQAGDPPLSLGAVNNIKQADATIATVSETIPNSSSDVVNADHRKPSDGHPSNVESSSETLPVAAATAVIPTAQPENDSPNDKLNASLLSPRSQASRNAEILQAEISKHANDFDDALQFLSFEAVDALSQQFVALLSSGAADGYRDEAAVRELLRSTMASTGLPADEVCTPVENIFVRFAHRIHTGEVSIAEVIRRFCLGQIHKPKRHSFTPNGAHTVSGSVNTATTTVHLHHHQNSHPLSGSDVLKLSQSYGTLNAEQAAAAASAQDEVVQESTAEVFVPSAELTILHRMFRRFDTNRDGYIVINDIAPTLEQ